MEINGYQLSRCWFNFCFDNPEKITPTHTAIYCFAIEHCNRLGWKEKFGFPSQMTMDALGIKNHHTYKRYFDDLVQWGFFVLVQKSSNQYSANIISLASGMSKNSKALSKHASKHHPSTPQSIDSIDKQLNQETIKQINNDPIIFDLESNPAGLFIGIKDGTKIMLKIHQQSFDKYLQGTFGMAYEAQKINIRSQPPIKEFFEKRNGDIFSDNNHVWNSFKKLWLTQDLPKSKFINKPKI